MHGKRSTVQDADGSPDAADHGAPEAPRRQLFAIIKARSFRRGRITLASGVVSDYYFDMKPTMFDPAGASLIAELLLDELAELKVDAVGGLAIGAVPLVATVVARSHQQGRPISGFFVRAQVKDHGTRRRVEGTTEKLTGKRVAILEDVTTTGGSAALAIEAAQEDGAEVVGVVSLVDRLEGAPAHFEKLGIAFRWLFTADEFLHGD